MDQIAPLLIGLVAGFALGALSAWLVLRGRGGAAAHPALAEARHAADLGAVRAEEGAARAELTARLAGADAAAQGLRDRLRDQEARIADLAERHDRERAAHEERQRAERHAREQREREEARVLQVLAPVQETLRSMQAKVAELETQRSVQHGELAQQLRSAAESEERLRSTADSLHAALKSNSTRGVWGETQLRTVVEAAGLLERVDFDVQRTVSSDRGAGRPDMVVSLPGGKSIAVDAKVPFTSYMEANAIPATALEPALSERRALIKRHVDAVRAHITALGSKAYWEGLDTSPEMVIAFIPSESLLSSALEADPTILEFAFAKRVALASPVTLFSVLKTVAVSWRHAVVTDEARTLLDTSRELYSRLATMTGHIEKLGRSVKATVNDYNRFVGSLEHSVLPSARKLGAMDESKVLGTPAGVEESPRELTAPELVTRELDALDELGVGRGALDAGGFELAGLDASGAGEGDAVSREEDGTARSA